MSLNSSLRELGLHKSEVVVYLYLLRNGISTVINVSHGTKIARSNCYYVIRQLLQKGLISKQVLGNKVAFAATELFAIDDYIESKSRIAKAVMPELEAVYNRGSLKPQVTFYSTEASISELLTKLLNTDNLTFYGSKPGDPEMIKVFFDNIKNTDDKLTRVFIHPRRSINCYFILWLDKIAIIPISTTPHITVVQNSDIASSISTMIKG
ncbi:MAG: helix-turn-helix domain-containing protein [Patescibacteria group bacterium]|jgi:sugar-specific transcriptional regulator TrmB